MANELTAQNVFKRGNSHIKKLNKLRALKETSNGYKREFQRSSTHNPF